MFIILNIGYHSSTEITQVAAKIQFVRVTHKLGFYPNIKLTATIDFEMHVWEIIIRLRVIII